MVLNGFDKKLFKLLNNAYFGKTMESQAGRRNIYFKSEKDGPYYRTPILSSLFNRLNSIKRLKI